MCYVLERGYIGLINKEKEEEEEEEGDCVTVSLYHIISPSHHITLL
jgi:hypothetical protein